MLGDSALSVLVLTVRWVLINALEFLCLCFFSLTARKIGIQLVFVFGFWSKNCCWCLQRWDSTSSRGVFALRHGISIFRKFAQVHLQLPVRISLYLFLTFSLFSLFLYPSVKPFFDKLFFFSSQIIQQLLLSTKIPILLDNLCSCILLIFGCVQG